MIVFIRVIIPRVDAVVKRVSVVGSGVVFLKYPKYHKDPMDPIDRGGV